ncbi:hypothetical protein L596_025890 [Steinernema carpocapsae]|uniref:Uncharacterized protein n=1 Tax=Steinernema carpocapsae TaxID=34508 RepID=A0A4U5M968_STECR|nr:hypothetical protein L596_025890 [Steinernema carpocapsae]
MLKFGALKFVFRKDGPFLEVALFRRRHRPPRCLRAQLVERPEGRSSGSERRNRTAHGTPPEARSQDREPGALRHRGNARSGRGPLPHRFPCKGHRSHRPQRASRGSRRCRRRRHPCRSSP